MIQLSTQPTPGPLQAVRAAGFPLGTTSDFALAFADLAGAATAVAVPPAPPGVITTTLPIGRQVSADDGKDLPDTLPSFDADADEDAPADPAPALPQPAIDMATTLAPQFVAVAPLAQVAITIDVSAAPSPAPDTGPIVAGIQPRRGQPPVQAADAATPPRQVAATSPTSTSVDEAPVATPLVAARPVQPRLPTAPAPAIETKAAETIASDTAALPEASAPVRLPVQERPRVPIAPVPVAPPDTAAGVRKAAAAAVPTTAATARTAPTTRATGVSVNAPARTFDVAPAIGRISPYAVSVPTSRAAAPQPAVSKVAASPVTIAAAAPVAVTPTAAPVQVAPAAAPADGVPAEAAGQPRRGVAAQPPATIVAVEGRAAVPTDAPAIAAVSQPIQDRPGPPRPIVAIAPDAGLDANSTIATPIVEPALSPRIAEHLARVLAPIAPQPAPVATTAVGAQDRPQAAPLPAGTAPHLPAAQHTASPFPDAVMPDTSIPTVPAAAPVPATAPQPVVPPVSSIDRPSAGASVPTTALPPVVPLAATTSATAPVITATVRPATVTVSAPATTIAGQPRPANGPLAARFDPVEVPTTPTTPEARIEGSRPVHVTVVALPPVAPSAPQLQPASQAFAAAMFAAAAPVDRPRDEAGDALALLSVPVTAPTSAAMPAIAVAPTAQVATPTLDTTRDDWMASMIDRIETLRDESGGVRETRMKLAPEALGGIEVSVRRDEAGAIHVRIAAETHQARTLLAEAAPRLAEMAETRGVKLGGSSIDQQGAQGFAGDRREPPAAPAPVRHRPASATTDTTDTTDTRIA